jgi:hypothetical protein
MNIATGDPGTLRHAISARDFDEEPVILLTERQLADQLDRVRSNQHPDSRMTCEVTLMGYALSLLVEQSPDCAPR